MCGQEESLLLGEEPPQTSIYGLGCRKQWALWVTCDLPARAIEGTFQILVTQFLKHIDCSVEFPACPILAPAPGQQLYTLSCKRKVHARDISGSLNDLWQRCQSTKWISFEAELTFVNMTSEPDQAMELVDETIWVGKLCWPLRVLWDDLCCSEITRLTSVVWNCGQLVEDKTDWQAQASCCFNSYLIPPTTPHPIPRRPAARNTDNCGPKIVHL